MNKEESDKYISANLNLFELDSELNNIYAALHNLSEANDFDEEFIEKLEAEVLEGLKVTEQNKAEKLESYCSMISMLDGDIATIDKRSDSLRAMKNSKNKIKVRLKETIRE